MNFTVPATSVKVITIVVCSIAVAAILCIITLSYCLIYGKWSEGSLLTAFVALTGQLIGSLTGLLVNTRTSPGDNTDMPKTDKPIP